MKKILISFILIIICCSLTSSEIQAVINTNYITVQDAYCTVQYKSSKKIKVGIEYNNIVTYYDYQSNKKLNYAFDKGNGDYTIKLYEQVKGSSYRVIEKKSATVNLTDNLLPYLISTYDIYYSENGILAKMASKLCKTCKTEWDKVFTLKNYVSLRINYDNDLATQISNKFITTYIPSPLNTWYNKKGICYDIASLFAAMCRTQNIPCKIQKGYVNEVYHAWNEVYVDGEWYPIDVKQPVSK